MGNTSAPGWKTQHVCKRSLRAIRLHQATGSTSAPGHNRQRVCTPHTQRVEPSRLLRLNGLTSSARAIAPALEGKPRLSFLPLLSILCILSLLSSPSSLSLLNTSSDYIVIANSSPHGSAALAVAIKFVFSSMILSSCMYTASS